jgi:pyruvate dehydrogenase E2 component (dihydrolipoamide acetyltransferase)
VLASVTAGPGLTRAAQTSPEVSRYQPGVTAGSALGGRVSAADLAAMSLITTPRHDVVEYTDTPIRGVRKIIAERMVQSLATAAQVSYQVTAPAAGLLALRARLKAADPALGLSTVTIGDLVAFAAARVAVRHPAINAHVIDGVLRSYQTVHMGLAVETPRGLMVPTVSDASSASLKAFSANTKALAAECQDGSISPDLLTGATFTVTNLGSFGIEGFTPIVNVPQTSILGVGAIFPRPIAGPDGAVGLEDRISFSLTADHRVVDGADAARFLQELTAAITHIDLTVLS